MSRALRRRYGRALPDPAGGWAKIQRMMKVYVEHEGLGEYVWNSAIPTMRGGWTIWVRPKGNGRSREMTVTHADVDRVYARRGLS